MKLYIINFCKWIPKFATPGSGENGDVFSLHFNSLRKKMDDADIVAKGQ